MKINLTFLFAVGLLAFAACNDPEECDPMGMTYTEDIASIINGNCATSGCHEMASTSTFEMHDYASTKAAVDFGRILGAINHQTGFEPMPYPAGSDKLDQCNIDKITTWISDGAPE